MPVPAILAGSRPASRNPPIRCHTITRGNPPYASCLVLGKGGGSGHAPLWLIVALARVRSNANAPALRIEKRNPPATGSCHSARKRRAQSTRTSSPPLAIGASTDQSNRNGRVDFGAPPGFADSSRRVPHLRPGQFSSTVHQVAEEAAQLDAAAPGAGWAVVIVSSLPAFATGLESWLANAAHGWVVGATCESASEAIDVAAHAARVVVVATDELDGVAVGRDLRAAAGSALLLVLTSICEPAREVALVRAGASGVLSMSAPRREVLRAVCDVIIGRSVVSAAGVRFLADERIEPGPHAFTVRQREVLELLADGLSTAQIAERLVVTPSTVKTHLSRLGGRLGLSGQRALAVNASALLARDVVGDAMSGTATDYQRDGVASEMTASSTAGRW